MLNLKNGKQLEKKEQHKTPADGLDQYQLHVYLLNSRNHLSRSSIKMWLIVTMFISHHIVSLHAFTVYLY